MKKNNQSEKPLDIKVVSVILFLMGVFLLASSTSSIEYGELVNEELKIESGVGFAFAWFAILIILAFLGSHGLEKATRRGWLAAIIFFSLFVLTNIALLFIDKTGAMYGMSILSILSLVLIYYLSRENVRELFK